MVEEVKRGFRPMPHIFGHTRLYEAYPGSRVGGGY